MDWKNQLTKTPYLVLFIVLIAVGVGTASALVTITLAGAVIIEDSLLVQGETKVTDSSIISERTSINSDNLVIQRPGGAVADVPRFVVSQRTNDVDLWIYGFDGSTFKNFVEFDFEKNEVSFPSSGSTLVIDNANDKVGIGTDSPSSELEVVGDIAVSGKLIGPDLLSVYVNFQDKNGTSAGTQSVSAVCDEGDIATGGGGGCFSGGCGTAKLRLSSPLGSLTNPSGWFLHLENPGSSEGIGFRAYVMCLDLDPPHVP